VEVTPATRVVLRHRAEAVVVGVAEQVHHRHGMHQRRPARQTTASVARRTPVVEVEVAVIALLTQMIETEQLEVVGQESSSFGMFCLRRPYPILQRRLTVVQIRQTTSPRLER
jgi:hypothetical protein